MPFLLFCFRSRAQLKLESTIPDALVGRPVAGGIEFNTSSVHQLGLSWAELAKIDDWEHFFCDQWTLWNCILIGTELLKLEQARTIGSCQIFFSHKNHVIWSKLINAGFHTEIWQGRIEKIDSFLFEKIDQNIILRLVAFKLWQVVFKLRQVVFKLRQVAFKLRQDAFIS